MRSSPPTPPSALVAGLVLMLLSASCSERRGVELPLLVIAGPDRFTSFEMRTPIGEIVWRLEADRPSPLPHLVYASVPRGFRQTFPDFGAPRALTLGEDLIMESRIPNRVFVHYAFANTSGTVQVLRSEMRRTSPIAPEDRDAPESPESRSD